MRPLAILKVSKDWLDSSSQEEKYAMPDERDPKLPPPRHPTTGPIQPDTMPDRPRPPIEPSPKREEEIRKKEERKKGR